jgi:hypothetical protein
MRTPPSSFFAAAERLESRAVGEPLGVHALLVAVDRHLVPVAPAAPQ